MDGIDDKPVVAPEDRAPLRETIIHGLSATNHVSGILDGSTPAGIGLPCLFLISPAWHFVTVKANLLASGIYLYRMTAGASDETKRLVILNWTNGKETKSTAFTARIRTGCGWCGGFHGRLGCNLAVTRRP